MTKQIFILIFSLAGIFLMPEFSVACGMESDMEASCCQTKIAEQTTSAIPSHPGYLQNEKADHKCDGECNHSACQCPAMNIVVALPFVEDGAGYFPGLIEKSISPFIENGLVSGFHSIWLPPKIS